MRLGLGLNLTRAGGVPFYADATVALDFANNRYRNGLNAPVYADPTLVSGWSFSRTGVEYEATSSGLLVPFASGVPAITDLGLQVWEARTNLTTWSEDLTNAAWTKSNSTAAASTIAAPNGSVAGSLHTATAAFGNANQSVVKAASSLAYTLSAYFKAGTSGNVRLVMAGDAGVTNGVGVNADVSAGTVSAPAAFGAGWGTPTATITPAANGYYRVTLTATSNTTTTLWYSTGFDGAASNGTTHYTFGVQPEQASFAGPYIPTTSASATRGAASASVGVTLPAEATIYTEYYAPALPSTAPSRQYLWSVADSGNSRLTVRAADTASPQPTYVVGDGAATSGLDPVTTTAGQLVKTAASYSSLSAQAGFAVNGTDSTAARKYDPAQIGAKTLYVGQSESSANQGDVILRRLVIYPSFLSSAQRIAITS